MSSPRATHTRPQNRPVSEPSDREPPAPARRAMRPPAPPGCLPARDRPILRPAFQTAPVPLSADCRSESSDRDYAPESRAPDRLPASTESPPSTAQPSTAATPAAGCNPRPDPSSTGPPGADRHGWPLPPPGAKPGSRPVPRAAAAALSRPLWPRPSADRPPPSSPPVPRKASPSVAPEPRDPRGRWPPPAGRTQIPPGTRGSPSPRYG